MVWKRRRNIVCVYDMRTATLTIYLDTTMQQKKGNKSKTMMMMTTSIRFNVSMLMK